jgi:hypothetical protein
MYFGLLDLGVFGVMYDLHGFSRRYWHAFQGIG